MAKPVIMGVSARTAFFGIGQHLRMSLPDGEMRAFLRWFQDNLPSAWRLKGHCVANELFAEPEAAQLATPLPKRLRLFEDSSPVGTAAPAAVRTPEGHVPQTRVGFAPPVAGTKRSYDLAALQRDVASLTRLHDEGSHLSLDALASRFPLTWPADDPSLRTAVMHMCTALSTIGLRSPVSDELRGLLDVAAANLGTKFQKGKIDVMRTLLARLIACQQVGAEP